MRRVELKDIRNFACQGTDLVVEPGELLVLLGPNGAGKTTLLNVIAGLVAYKGQVLFDDEPVDDQPALARQVGYVFQDLVLFPHLDVAANIAYGLHAGRQGAPEREERVAQMLELLAISHLAARFPAKLSGGERQRVALARALAPKPKILLLDEPFSSLDARTSSFLRAELRYLQRDLGTTAVFVTHDLVEAEQVADRIAVIQDGAVDRIGTFQEVLLSTRAGQTAEPLGSPNVLPCTASEPLGHGLTRVDCDGLPVVVPHSGQRISGLVVLPRDVQVSAHRPPAEINVFEGMVKAIEEGPGGIVVRLDVAGHPIAAELPRAPFESNRLQPGAPVFVELSLMKLRVLADAETP